MLEQTSLHAVTLSAASNWCSSSVKSPSGCVCRPICLHSGFKEPPSQTDVSVAWNRATKRGSPLPKMFSHRLDAATTHSSIFHSCSCVVGEDTKETRGVNLSVRQASGSHAPTLVIFQALQVNRIRILLVFSPFYLFIFMTRNVVNLKMLWSGVSQRGFIQHSSPER